MDAMDFCRFCHANMRIKGTLGGTIRIFDKKNSNEKSVYERLIALGLTLFRSPLISYRMCKICFRQLGRMEDDISTLRRWEQEDKDKEEQKGDTFNATSTVATVEVPVVSGRLSPDDSESACSSRTYKRDREPTPSKTPRKIKKHRPNPVTPVHSDTTSPSPTATRKLLSKPTTVMPERQSLLEVTIRGKKTVCDNSTAGIVEHITRGNWTTAANLIVRHDELFGEVKENVLKVIEDESKTLCNPYKNFMLWRSSPDDLKDFSLANLMSDLQRMSPFLFSIFHRISKQSPNVTCAAAAIALRGREPRLSAFAYYVNNVLLYGGAKKAVFERLGKLGITTSHGHAIRKQRELAQTCAEEFHLLQVANELLLDFDSDGNTMDADGAPGWPPLSDTASQVSVLSDFFASTEEFPAEQQERSSSLVQEEPQPPQIKERPEEADGSTLTLEVKSVHDNRESEPIAGTSTGYMKTQADVEDCRTSQPTCDDQALSSHCSESDTEEKSGGDDENRETEPVAGTSTEHMKTQAYIAGWVRSQPTSDEELLSAHCSESDTEEKSEGDDENREREPLSSNSAERMKIQADVEDSSQADAEDSDDWEETREVQSDLNSDETQNVEEDNNMSKDPNSTCMMTMIHTGEKPCKCTVCGRGFSLKVNLKRHMMIHTGERPCTCAVCGKRFIRMYHLKRHMMIHTGIKPCPDLKTTSTKSSTEKKSFPCSYCGKTFNEKRGLNIHKAIHTGEKPCITSTTVRDFAINYVKGNEVK